MTNIGIATVVVFIKSWRKKKKERVIRKRERERKVKKIEKFGYEPPHNMMYMLSVYYYYLLMSCTAHS